MSHELYILGARGHSGYRLGDISTARDSKQMDGSVNVASPAGTIAPGSVKARVDSVSSEG